MPSRNVRGLVLVAALAAALPALAQSGLRVPERPEPGIDPTFARGWLAPNFDRFGFASYQWKEAMGLASSQRMNWSYTLSERSSLGMSLRSPGDVDDDQRHVSVFGRYWFAADWAVSAQSQSRDASGLLRLNDLRIGVQRRF